MTKVTKDSRLSERVNALSPIARTLWASTCAEHVLTFCEGANAFDTRPREAIKAARQWAMNPTPANRHAANIASSAEADAVASMIAIDHVASSRSASDETCFTAAYDTAFPVAYKCARRWQFSRLAEMEAVQ